MFLTLLCASIFDSDFLTDSGEESDVIHATFKPFTDESWRVRDASMTKDDFEHTATTIKIPRNTPIEKAVMTTVTIVTEDAYTFGALKCNAQGAQVQDAVCYGDATDGKEPFRWGITPNVGETEHVQFYMVLRNGTLKLSVYLYNDNQNEDVTFLLPEFWIYHKQYSKLPASRTELVSGHTRVWRKTGHVTQEMGKIKLYSAALPNAHAFPSSIGDGNLPYSSSAGYYGIVPVTANATHIVGFDIYHDSFMQPWSHNTIVDDNGETGRTLELSMMARNESGADITYLVMEVDTVSWLDAVEKWHSEFPDVYHKTQGWGLWATFANLQKMFPNSTEDIDLFHVGFQWGSSYSGMKPYIPNHIYSEPTLIHLDIPYNQDTLVSDMETCEYDPSLSKTDAEKAALKEKCQVVLDSALRDKNLNLVCREEDAPWNVGLCCNVIYEGKAREYFYRQFKNSIEAYLKQGAPPNMTGGAFDSFSAGQTVTYVDESNPRPGDGYLPYFLLDSDQKPFVCLHAAMFEGFKDYMVYSPQGMLMNTFYVPPEMVKYQVNAGFEVGLSSETGFEYSKYYRKYFWGMRFNGGCHSISHVENRNREYSIKYVESYMSIMASYGSASSWFSADAANENFWTSPESFAAFRPTLERWMPKLNEAFNGTIFYANGLGMVTMEFPEDGQNPPIDELDISSTALFCRPDSQASDGVVECYLSIFLGYQSKEAPQGFSRVAKVNIKGATSLSCWFVANDMTCSKSGDTVTVALRNVGSGQTYRTAIVKFERNGHDNSKAIVIGVSVAVVVLLCAIGAVIAVFLIRKKKKNVDKLRGYVHV